jgi:hypothetical protein
MQNNNTLVVTDKFSLASRIKLNPSKHRKTNKPLDRQASAPDARPQHNIDAGSNGVATMAPRTRTRAIGDLVRCIIALSLG